MILGKYDRTSGKIDAIYIHDTEGRSHVVKDRRDRIHDTEKHDRTLGKIGAIAYMIQKSDHFLYICILNLGTRITRIGSFNCSYIAPTVVFRQLKTARFP